MLQLLYGRCRVYFRSLHWHLRVDSSYVIECSFSLTLIINDMKRTHKKEKVFKSKKPSRGSKHVPGPAASTSTSTGTADLMPSTPSFDLDGTANAQVTVGVSVRVYLRPSHL